MMNPIFWLILQLLDIYTWIVIAAVVASWLIAFNVVNLHNNIVRSIVSVLDLLTEPVFRQVRRLLPSFGGIDLSPIVVFLGIMFIRYVIIYISATWMI
jgi:YggT family protein